MSLCETHPARTPWISLQPTRSTADDILEEVAAEHCLTVREMLGDSRKHRISHPRQHAMYELRRRTTLSTTQIARKLRLKDHTTVVHGADAHADRTDQPRIRTKKG